MGELYFVVDDGGVYNVLSEEDLNTYGVEDDQIVGKPFTSFNVASKKADILNRQAEEASSDFSPSRGYFDESRNPIRITEGQLRNVIAESVRKVLKEGGMFDYLTGKHHPSKKEIADPTVEDVIKQNGWLVKKVEEKGDGKVYRVEPKTVGGAPLDGVLSLKELLDDLKVFGVSVSLIKREPVFPDYPKAAEKAVILVK